MEEERVEGKEEGGGNKWRDEGCGGLFTWSPHLFQKSTPVANTDLR